MIWRVILTRSRVLRDPFIISHPFLVVKGFLKSFFKIFRGSFRTVPWSQRKCPTIISQLFSFVKRFLKSFSKTFLVTFLGSLEVVPFAKRPAYYITSLFVCQEVFQKFFQLFSWFSFGVVSRFGASIRWLICSIRVRRSLTAVSDSRCPWQLAYYSTSPLNCQGVFTKFFGFGSYRHRFQFLPLFVVHLWQVPGAFDGFRRILESFPSLFQ